MGFHISGFNILIGNEAGDGGQLKDMMQSDVNETIKFLNEIHEVTKEFSANDTLDRWIFNYLYLYTLLGSGSELPKDQALFLTMVSNLKIYIYI